LLSQPKLYSENSPEAHAKKSKSKKKKQGSDGSNYIGSDIDMDSDQEASDQLPAGPPTILAAKQNHDVLDCGLCGKMHRLGDCRMTDNSENLAGYRELLLLHAEDEPIDMRVSIDFCAIIHIEVFFRSVQLSRLSMKF
jgi:hypothetical protein